MTGPDRIWACYDPDYDATYWKREAQAFSAGDLVDQYIRADLHTAALSAEYARGLRDAVQAVPTWGVDSDVGDKVRAAILALIPLSPSQFYVSRGADPDNKEPTHD